MSARIGLVGELLRVLFFVAPRSVNGVVPEVQKERFVLVRLNEPDRFIGQAVRDVFALRAIRDRSHVMFRTRLATFVDTVRRKIAAWPGAWLSVKRDLESMLLWPVFLTQAEVPLSEMPGSVTPVTQHFGKRVQLGIEITLADRIDELLVG